MLGDGLQSLVIGDSGSAQRLLEEALSSLTAGDPEGLVNGLLDDLGAIAGLYDNPLTVIADLLNPVRNVEPVVLTGLQIPGWSQPAAVGLPADHVQGMSNRDAHLGSFLYPLGFEHGDTPVNQGGVPVEDIAAFRWDDAAAAFIEIPVQVDEVFPYFLANGNSDFAFYSGADMELTYAWDTENWDAGETQDGCYAVYPEGRPDPVAGLDHDDEIVFMASDAGALAPTDVSYPEGVSAVQLVTLVDPLDPLTVRHVYLALRPGGSSFETGNGYVNYQRQADADQWIDRNFFRAEDPEKIGTSNTGYGANLPGTVCPVQGEFFDYQRAGCPQGSGQCQSIDRFPRDGLVVTTDTYRWEASGRWMIRDLRVRAPGDSPDNPAYWENRPDLIDRWKGRAFQQSPDSSVSLVGFEDEQVNWEANAVLIGERCGPVRCMRATWSADSGTNVTKTEIFYRDAVAYRYRVRVHPIPPDGLYTSWDYNRAAMVPEEQENVAGGRYYTLLRPQGMPIDGVNDDIGQIDGLFDIPAYFDVPDPSFNLPLGFYNWEQVSAKGDLGSLVYIFEIKGLSSLGNPTVVPYYRDDACFDDGTGDDPVPRPWPGEESTDPRVQQGYVEAARARHGDDSLAYADLACEDKQGVYGSHGVHYLVTHDTDNLFVGMPVSEIDGQQWQFMIPNTAPRNVGERYASVVRSSLLPVVVPLTLPDLSGLGD